MNTFDILKCKENYHDGMIINKIGDMINVLWGNGLISTEKDDLSVLAFVGHRNVRRFLLEDIRRIEKDDMADQSKEGVKYDKRRGKVVLLDMDFVERGRGVILHLYDPSLLDIMTGQIEPDEDQVFDIYTTNFEKMYPKDDKVMLQTMNSLYVLKEF